MSQHKVPLKVCNGNTSKTILCCKYGKHARLYPDSSRYRTWCQFNDKFLL